MKRFFQYLGHQLRTVHAPSALHERTVDLPLRGIRMEIDFLMGVLAVIMGGNITGDHHHGNTVQCRIGNSGRAIG